jgi:hypothetical protein
VALKFAGGALSWLANNVIAPLIDRISDLIGWVKDAITWLNSLNLVTEHTAEESIKYHTGQMPGKAGGGPVFAGGVYRVGENREETLVMNRSGGGGYVVPSSAGRGRSGGDGGVVNHIHVYVDGKEVATMVDRRLFRDLRRAAPTKGRV